MDYNEGVKYYTEKDYKNAIACFQKEINKKGPNRAIAIGGLGYCYFKEKRGLFKAKNQFELKEFLYASCHPDFEKYVTIWALVYYNLEKYKGFNNIMYNLQKFQINNHTLKDYQGKSFDKNHPLAKFIEALIKWKLEERPGDAKKILLNINYKAASVIKSKIDAELKYINGEIGTLTMFNQQKASMTLERNEFTKNALRLIEVLQKNGSVESLKQSISLYSTFNESDSAFIEAKRYLAKSKIRLYGIEEGLEIYENIIKELKKNKDDNKRLIAEIYVEMAKVCLQSEQYKEFQREILKYLEEAKKFLPDYSEIHLVFGDYYFAFEGYEAAYKEYNFYKGVYSTEDEELESKIENCRRLKENREHQNKYSSSFSFSQPFFSPYNEEEPMEEVSEELLSVYSYIKIPRNLSKDSTFMNEINQLLSDSQKFKFEQGKDEYLILYDKLENPFLYYTKSKGDLFNYLHIQNKSLKYFEKISIIKKIAKGLRQYYETLQDSNKNLCPYNIFVCVPSPNQNEAEEPQREEIIKVGFAPLRLLENDDNKDYIKIWEFINNNYPFFGLNLIIWEIMTGKIPFEDNKNIRCEQDLVSYLNKITSNLWNMANMTSVFKFYFKITLQGVMLESYKNGNKEFFNKFLDDIEQFPDDEGGR